MRLSEEQKADIQGLVGSGYSHLSSVDYIFLHIDSAELMRKWLGGFIPDVMTGADWPRDEQGRKVKPRWAWHIAFTYSGLMALGLPDRTLNTFPIEFMEGMSNEHRSRILGDTGTSSPEHWQVGGKTHQDDQAIHVLLTLYSEDTDIANEQIAQLTNELDQLSGAMRMVHRESGRRPEQEKEHFGFRDGLSNPLILGYGKREQEPGDNVIKTGEFILGYLNEYDQFPATPLVWDTDDAILPRFNSQNFPPELRDLGRNGTYIVYRKLQQDVSAFWGYIQGLSQQGESADQLRMSQIAAKFVGRWPDGAPLTVSPDYDDPEQSNVNDFVYLSEDLHGERCPYSAHIRRANPRDSFVGASSTQASFKATNQHRILRRGSVYGDRLIGADQTTAGAVPLDVVDDGKERGLHFMCVNTDIRRQFEFVQQGWCNNPKFNGLYNDKDPIIGDTDGSSYVTIEGNPIRERIQGVQRFVTVRGGDYFFLPSITALKYLASYRER